MLSSLETVSVPYSEDVKISAAELARYGAEGLIFRGDGSTLVVQLYNRYAES